MSQVRKAQSLSELVVLLVVTTHYVEQYYQQHLFRKLMLNWLGVRNTKRHDELSERAARELSEVNYDLDLWKKTFADSKK